MDEKEDLELLLAEVHYLAVRLLRDKLESGDITPGELTCAIKLIKDNNMNLGTQSVDEMDPQSILDQFPSIEDLELPDRKEFRA